MHDDFPQIRPASSKDLPELLDLYQHLAPGDARPSLGRAGELFGQFAAYTGSAILVCEFQASLVASCTLVVVPNLTRGGSAYGLIENVVTHRDFRRRGFGKMLLRAATDAAWGGWLLQSHAAHRFQPARNHRLLHRCRV